MIKRRLTASTFCLKLECSRLLLCALTGVYACEDSTHMYKIFKVLPCAKEKNPNYLESRDLLKRGKSNQSINQPIQFLNDISHSFRKILIN